jgi:hypothetical protein
MLLSELCRERLVVACTLLVGLAVACHGTTHGVTEDPSSPLAQGAKSTESNRVRDFVDETITVACGKCVFNMDVKGCPWAAEIDGTHYLVKGEVPSEDDHDAHAADGMCRLPRKAVIHGQLRDGVLTVSKMKLVP